VKHISSRDNATFKSLRLLAHSGRERRKQGRTVLDGVHLVETYLARVGLPFMIVVSESGADRAEVRACLHRCPACETLVCADSIFTEISPVETPAGLLAVIAIPAVQLRLPIEGSCVVLDRVQDAGNVGAVLRTAAAAGVSWALLTEGCAHAWSPKVLRSAMGAHFSINVAESADVPRLLTGFSGTIVATRPDADANLFDLDLKVPVAWLFGSEGGGLEHGLAALASVSVRIPMAAATESLNVAAAAAICLFEQLRQRRAG
jgi:TrmH family RNA methyltransferase